MKSTTAGQHSFSQIPSANIQRSKFNRSCGLKTTFDAGLLTPIFVEEALPGDTMALKMSAFARFATPIKPILDNMTFDVHFWSVPNRLVWTNWQRFNGEQNNPGDSTEFEIPQVSTPTGFPSDSIYDYMGIPPLVANLSVSALPLRAYNLIWNEWYRAEDIQDSVAKLTNDGPDLLPNTTYKLLRRGKRHDYFSSALPSPQKGPAVTIPFSSNAPVISDSVAPGPLDVPGTGVPHFLIGGNVNTELRSITSQAQAEWAQLGTSADAKWSVTEGTGLQADLQSVIATSINQIRQAFQIQKLYERDSRGGTRYTEILRSHFGVVSPDARLQRPEFLGGGQFNLNVVPVPMTQASESPTPTPETSQGNLAGFGTGSATGIGFTKSFVEHCTVIGLISARADLNYQQGLNRMWSRLTRWDFYWPALQAIGEQAILNKEIYAQGDANDDLVFGYIPRYDEYRYKPSMTTSKMRSTHPLSLDVWHLAQEFSSLPTLSPTFIEENPPVGRVIAVPTEPHFMLDAFFQFNHARPLPTYGVPGLVDHF